MTQDSKLPDGWQTLHFDQFAENIAERVDPAEVDAEYYVGLEHLDPESLKIRRWGTPDDVKGTKLRFRKGDIIFGRRRFYQRKLAVAEFDGICSAHAMVLRACEGVMLQDLLPFFLQSETFFQRAMQISVGSLSPTINWRTLARQEFAIPPLDEQRRIAEILWTAEKVRQKQEDLTMHLWKFRQALLDCLLPGPSTTGSSAFVKLRDICKMQNGRAFPSQDYQEQGIKLLRPGNLGSDGYFDWREDVTRFLPIKYLEITSDYVVEPGDVVINLTAQSLEDGFMGRVCMTRQDDRSLLNQRIGLFKCANKILPEYLFRYLQTTRFRRLVEARCEGSKIKHLYWRHLEDFELLCPPIEKQKEIVEQLAAADAAIKSARIHREEISTLRRSLGEKLLLSEKVP